VDKERKMARFLQWFLMFFATVFVAVSLAGCDDSSGDDGNDNNNTSVVLNQHTLDISQSMSDNFKARVPVNPYLPSHQGYYFKVYFDDVELADISLDSNNNSFLGCEPVGNYSAFPKVVSTKKKLEEINLSDFSVKMFYYIATQEVMSPVSPSENIVCDLLSFSADNFPYTLPRLSIRFDAR